VGTDRALGLHQGRRGPGGELPEPRNSKPRGTRTAWKKEKGEDCESLRRKKKRSLSRGSRQKRDIATCGERKAGQKNRPFKARVRRSPPSYKQLETRGPIGGRKIAGRPTYSKNNTKEMSLKKDRGNRGVFALYQEKGLEHGQGTTGTLIQKLGEGNELGKVGHGNGDGKISPPKILGTWARGCVKGSLAYSKHGRGIRSGILRNRCGLANHWSRRGCGFQRGKKRVGWDIDS